MEGGCEGLESFECMGTAGGLETHKKAMMRNSEQHM